jgi:cytoskeletal protein CcmA (bactofilin family)
MNAPGQTEDDGRLAGDALDPDSATRMEPGAMSVIGTDILVTGNIEAKVDLHIEGKVIGDVRCATLILGERSSVEGSIFAKRVRVAGSVDGAIETTDLAIESAARVKGDVSYSRLRIANGGVVEGTMKHVALPGEDGKLKLVDSDKSKVHYIE